MQKLGQHFLKNPDVLEKIISGVAPQKNDVVIEIGPGHGELTVPLIEKLSEFDGNLTSIEKDNELADVLITKYSESKNFAVVKGDALKLLPEVITSATESAITKNPSRRYKIIGNIPYYITGKLLRVISELENKPERAVFMVQNEVAERVCAVAPDMNRLAASVQFWAHPEIIAFVPKKDFSPPPKVDSAVMLLTTRTGEDEHAKTIHATHYYSAVRSIFAQPRKTLLNNISEAKRDASKEKIVGILNDMGIAHDIRPQNLKIEQIIAIARVFFTELE